MSIGMMYCIYVKRGTNGKGIETYMCMLYVYKYECNEVQEI